MQIIDKNQYVYNMSAENLPALKVKAGCVVEFHTYDCFQNQITNQEQSISELNWGQINPATGPLYIEDAKVGDILKVDILKIDINDYGVMASIPGAGLLGDEVKEPEVKVLPIINGKVEFNDNIKIPINPMIGVIGVAPNGEAISCGTPGSHGGNMDNKKIKEGTTLYLPVFVEGALLSMGDLHGAMGDGEIMVSGLEVGGKVQVKVDIIKNNKINNPILEDKENYYTIASHEDLLNAIKIATKDMQELVMRKLNLSFNEAGMLLSAAGNAEICQVVDPLLTVRFTMPKSILNEIL